MPDNLKTPGVYIQEQNAFPASAIAVPTAVPVFIGYTEKAERDTTSLLYKPTRISSLAEYITLFGLGFKPIFQIVDIVPGNAADITTLSGRKKALKISADNTLYFYNSIRFFYANGGADCYILSVGTYQGLSSLKIQFSDFLSPQGANNKESVFDILKREAEPTLVVIPDIIALGEAAYPLYVQVLQHCNDTQNRFGIFDLAKQTALQQTDAIVTPFRNAMNTNYLNYGAAYYPWLNTSVIQSDEFDYTNIAGTVNDLIALLPQPDPANAKKDDEGNKIATIRADNFNADNSFKAGCTEKTFHQSLLKVSPAYTGLMDQIKAYLNELPPSAAMAGIYTNIDNTRGVWKAPANVAVNMVTAPSVVISSDQQQNLNVDVIGGKSINVIRSFTGVGVLVWGARTLDGNSNDWRYISIRRTTIMIEQSLKLATMAYVFEPNDANTWVSVRSMIQNFLMNLWKQGALMGAKPEQAFNVQIGLGQTMTADDILNGLMIVMVELALVRPAEFIVLTFRQQQQKQ